MLVFNAIILKQWLSLDTQGQSLFLYVKTLKAVRNAHLHDVVFITYQFGQEDRSLNLGNTRRWVFKSNAKGQPGPLRLRVKPQKTKEEGPFTSRSNTFVSEEFKRMALPSRNSQSAFFPLRHRRMALGPGSPLMLRLEMNCPMGLFSRTVAKMSEPPRQRLARR